MINLRFLLGLYPSTEKIEAKEAAIIKEYNELESYINSEELSHFLTIQKEVNSPEFAAKKQELKNLHYPGSLPFQKEKEHLQLKKSKKITNYYKVFNSPSYKNYLEIKDSELLNEYEKHLSIVKSGVIDKTKQELKALTYESSPEFRQEKEFTILSKSKEITNYFKVLNTESYKLYSLMHDTHDLNHFVELKKYFESHPDLLKKKKKDITDQEEAEKINEYLILQKDKRFQLYFKFTASKEFALFQRTVSEKIIDKYEELKKVIESESFQQKKAYLKLSFQKKWEATEEFTHATAFDKLGKDPKIKDYNKFVISEAFKLFNEVIQSGEIEHFEELEKYVKSEEFAESKKYLNLNFKEKWGLTDESKHEIEYHEVLKSEKYKWYLKASASSKFDEVKKWKVTFEDDFNENNLNDQKWLTRYFWGDNFLNEGYSLSEDLHLLTDGKNLKINNGVLNIETRKENAAGKSWTPMFGFMPRDFEYTSGIINSGKSFRQKYGKFRAKIKVNPSQDIHSTFWLASNQVIPHIDILKYSKNRYYIANFWKDDADLKKNINSMAANKLNKGFFIFELEWTKEALIWRINNTEIKKVSNGIPQEEMYIQLSSGIQQVKNTNTFPSTLEIDWVKCYQDVENTTK